MATSKSSVSAQKTQITVCIGKEGLPVGELAYVKDGAREYSVFAYGQDWLRHPSRFHIGPQVLAFYRNLLNLRLLFKNQKKLKLSYVFKWLDISKLKMPKLIDLCEQLKQYDKYKK